MVWVFVFGLVLILGLGLGLFLGLGLHKLPQLARFLADVLLCLIGIKEQAELEGLGPCLGELGLGSVRVVFGFLGVRVGLGHRVLVRVEHARDGDTTDVFALFVYLVNPGRL